MTESLPEPDPTPKPRGLWSLMPKASTELPPETPTEAQAGEPSPRSLFDVMRGARAVETQLLNPGIGDVELESRPVVENPELSSPDSSIKALPVPVRGGSRRSPSVMSARGSRRQFAGLACGLASIGFSALALRPEIWISVPGSVLGFTAVILGSLRLIESESRTRPASLRWISAAGILSGIFGIFLGPLYFTEVGRAIRESSGNSQTRQHLTQIGNGLKRHHDQYGSFPAGGVFEQLPAEKRQGLHGWMTFLLPFVGEQLVFELVNQSIPFDAIENRPAMGHEISVYYAAGGDRSRIGQGFAVAHFAGVGGEFDSENGILQAGIFDREASIRRNDVTDGLANTFAAGELAGNFPPWGDPENLRTIGRGLNNDINGFGNARGNGALFLFADGSVKFFVNRTDPKLLLQLSTRNGHEE